jgi:hypothetical protein
MTIDERLERLTGRHEALTESVEHLALQREEQNRLIDKILQTIQKDSENIAALARIAETHDKRLENLGG